MITLPAMYSTYLTGNARLVRIVGINLGDSWLWLPTVKTGVNWTLPTGKDGAIHTKYLSAEIDGRDVPGIGEIDHSGDFENGGGLMSVGDVDLNFLNQECFDEFLAQYDIERKEVEIYETYVVDVAEPNLVTVSIASDMVRVFTGFVQDSGEWDYQNLSVRVVDTSGDGQTQLPKNNVSISEYPHTPKDYVGKPIPIIYWSTCTTLIDDFEYGNLNVAPVSVIVDSFGLQLILASHPVTPVHVVDRDSTSLSCVCRYDSGLDGWAALESSSEYVYTDGDEYGNVKINLLNVLGATLFAHFYGQPKVRGTNSSGISDASAIVDDDYSTFLTLDSSDKVYQFFNGSPTFAEYIEWIYQRIQTKDAGGIVKLRYFNNDPSILTYSTGANISTVGANTIYQYRTDQDNSIRANNNTVPFQADISSNELILAAQSNLVVGWMVRVSSSATLPSPLQANTDYFVVAVSGSRIKLSLTEGGAAIDITDAGTSWVDGGFHFVIWQVPWTWDELLNCDFGIEFVSGADVTLRNTYLTVKTRVLSLLPGAGRRVR